MHCWTQLGGLSEEENAESVGCRLGFASLSTYLVVLNCSSAGARRIGCTATVPGSAAGIHTAAAVAVAGSHSWAEVTGVAVDPAAGSCCRKVVAVCRRVRLTLSASCLRQACYALGANKDVRVVVAAIGLLRRRRAVAVASGVLSWVS
jgi:hypothetical protein